MFCSATGPGGSESDGVGPQGPGALALPAIAEILHVRAALDEHAGSLALRTVSDASPHEFAVEGHIQDAALVY